MACNVRSQELAVRAHGALTWRKPPTPPEWMEASRPAPLALGELLAVLLKKEVKVPAFPPKKLLVDAADVSTNGVADHLANN